MNDIMIPEGSAVISLKDYDILKSYKEKLAEKQQEIDDLSNALRNGDIEINIYYRSLNTGRSAYRTEIIGSTAELTVLTDRVKSAIGEIVSEYNKGATQKNYLSGTTVKLWEPNEEDMREFARKYNSIPRFVKKLFKIK
jgi:hypothetical protein